MNMPYFSKKILKKVSLIVTISLVLILIVNLGVSEILKKESIRNKIIAKVSKRTNSDIKFEQIEFDLLPIPHITVKKGSFINNKKIKTNINFESIEIYPKIIPLLKREVEISSLEINEPKLIINLPTKQNKFNEDISDNSEPLLFYVEKYHKDLISFATSLPVINVEIDDGELDLIEDGKKVLKFRGIDTEYEFNNNTKIIKFSSRSNFANTIKFEALISPAKMQSSFDLYADDFYPQILSNFILENSSYISDNSKVDLKLNLEFDGYRNVIGDFRFSGLNINLINKEDSFNIKGTKLKGKFSVDDNQQSLSINNFNLNNPKLNLTAEIYNDKKNNKSTLKIAANDVDIKTTRDMALFSLNNYEITKKVFEVLRSGELESIIFHSESEKFEELFENENFELSGNIKEGYIFVPEVDLTFKNVNGNASIEKGILYGKNINGKTGKSILKKGTLKLGLGKDNDILNINSDIEVNLSELPSHLKRFIKNEWFLKFLSSLDNLRGNANGNLILGNKKSSVKAIFDASDFNLSFNYPDMPDEVILEGSELFYKESNIKFKKIRGNISNSEFTDLTGKYNWSNDSILEISSMKFNVLMEELYPLVSFFDKFPDYLKNYGKVKGDVTIKDLTFRRPVENPEKWNLNFTSMGTIYYEESLKYSLNFIKTPEKLKIDKLILKDENTDAKLSLEFSDKLYLIDYSGRLAETTTDRFLTDNAFSFGWIEGDIGINYLRNQISKSTAKGFLKGGKIVLPLNENTPIKINSISLKADKNNINIESLNLSLEESEFNILGSIYSDKDKITIDIDASADEIEWSEINKFFEDTEKNEKEIKKNESINLPIEGKLKVDISQFNYGKLFWQPFQADINFKRGNLNIVVNKASICDVSTTGNLLIDNDIIKADINAFSNNKKIEEALNCFFDDNERIFGEYGLRADISSNGNRYDIKETTNGEFIFHVKDGKVSNNNNMLLSILKVTNITEIYRGKMPDFSKNGLEFSEIIIKGKIENGIIKFKDATLESPYLGIMFSGYINLIDEEYDIKFRVAVLKTIHDVLKKVPLIKKLKAERIISIPVRIKGKFNNP